MYNIINLRERKNKWVSFVSIFASDTIEFCAYQTNYKYHEYFLLNKCTCPNSCVWIACYFDIPFKDTVLVYVLNIDF